MSFPITIRLVLIGATIKGRSSPMSAIASVGPVWGLVPMRILPQCETVADSINLLVGAGAHPAVFNAVMCDGSVHSISYTITEDVQRKLCNRKDRKPVDPTPYW